MAMKKLEKAPRTPLHVTIPLETMEKLLALVTAGREENGWGTVSLSSVVSRLLQKGLEGEEVRS